MEIIVCKDAEKAVALAARLMTDLVVEKPKAVLGLATGRTMESLYKKMAENHRDEGVDYSLVRSFNLDEYVGLAPENDQSYHYYMNEHLFQHINIDKRNTHVPCGIAEDLDAAAMDFEQEIEDCGGIDVQLLGIGRTGHIGFNDPLSSLSSRTRAKSLAPETIKQNSPLFAKPEDMPTRAVTMGVGTILDAKKTLMVITGTEKADIAAKAIEGPVTSMISASALQFHPSCVVILDEAAAVNLTQRKYYDWVFQNEPEWKAYQSYK